MKTGRPSLHWAQSNRRELKADDPSGPQGAPLPGTEPARWAAALANPRTRALEKPREPEARMWRHPRSSPAQGQATRSRLPWGPRQPSHSLGTAPSLAGQQGPRGAHVVLTPALTTESPEQGTGTALATAWGGLSHGSATNTL